MSIKFATDGLAYYTNNTTLDTEIELLTAQKQFLSDNDNKVVVEEFCRDAFNMAKGIGNVALTTDSDFTGASQTGLVYLGSNDSTTQKNYLKKMRILQI